MKMQNNGYFSAEPDREIINAGSFFCHACLVGKPASELSPDPRYCQGCYVFLLKEAEMLPENKRPAWIPKEGKIGHQKSIQVSGDVVLNMSTLNDKKSEVDIIQPSVAKVTRGKRGPKHKALPQELIEQWAGESMGSKAIASKLNSELGITVSYKTIQRLLSGGREFDKQTENKLSDKQGNLALLQHLILK